MRSLIYKRENNMDKEERIKNAIGNMDDSELIELWNECCYKAPMYSEGYIYTMDEFDALLHSDDEEIVEEAEYSLTSDKFNINHKYFCETVYGFESNDNPRNLSNYVEAELIHTILYYNNSFGNAKIQSVLDDTIFFYHRNEDSDRCYICFTEKEAQRLEKIFSKLDSSYLTKNASVIVAENAAQYNRLWNEPKFGGANINAIAIIYDKANEDEAIQRIKECGMHGNDVMSCLFELDELENAAHAARYAQNQTKTRDDGIEM